MSAVDRIVAYNDPRLTWPERVALALGKPLYPGKAPESERECLADWRDDARREMEDER